MKKFLLDQKEQIEEKLEQLNQFLSDFDRLEFTMLSYDGYALTLAGGVDLSSKTDFELKFSEVAQADLSKSFRLKSSGRPIQLAGYHEDSMIIKISDESGQAQTIECDGFDFKIIEGGYKTPFLQSRVKILADKVEAVNHFFAHNNINDMRTAYYDGHKLSLVASFDLCYYHDIELLFMEVKKINLGFYSGAGFLDENGPFLSLHRGEADSFKFTFATADREKSSVVCGDFDYKIGLVKYYDKMGRRKKGVIF